MIVTKEDIHDGKILKELVGDVFSKNTIFKKYWQKTEPMIQKNTCYLDKLKITPIIKVRKNSSIKNNINCTPRKLLLLSV